MTRRKSTSPLARAIPAAARPDWRPRWETLKADAVRVAWTQMMRFPGRRFWLYYRPADGPTWGTFLIVEDTQDNAPAGFVPVSPEPMPPADKAGIARWLEQYAGWLPMIGTDPD